jgi:ADP-ribose pyrophosphatase YjhB (NUDIX family)
MSIGRMEALAQSAAETADREPTNLRCSALVLRGDSVLLCRRANGGVEHWVLPGGTPRRGELARVCARREVREETGLAVEPSRVAFVLDATNLAAGQHLVEIVFAAAELDRDAAPAELEAGLQPAFVPLDRLSELDLLPPIGGHIKGFHGWTGDRTAAYLGNLWRPPLDGSFPAS